MRTGVAVAVLAGIMLATVGGGWTLAADAAAPPVRFEKGGTISEPQVTVKVAPVYPEQARKERIQGTVLLDLVVQADGSVGPIEAVESPDQLLTDAAVEAVRQWRYEPARDSEGVAVAVVFRVTIVFRLS